MDNTHIFGQCKLSPLSVDKLICVTLELARLEAHLKSFPTARKTILNLQGILISIAKDEGVTEAQYRAATKRLIEVTDPPKGKLKIAKDENEATGEDAPKTTDQL